MAQDTNCFDNDIQCFVTLNQILRYKNGKRIDTKNKEFIKPFEYLTKYVYAIENLEGYKNEEKKHPDIIWQCWFQGEENMPELVRVCTNSVKREYPDKKIILITEKNYQDYIQIPDCVIDKYKSGIIQYAQLSDIVRLLLLEKYGGVWIDSTVLLTGKLPDEVFSLPFFTYKNTLGLCFDYVKNMKDLELMSNYLNYSLKLPSSWLLSSCANNIIIKGWIKLMLEYWQNENFLIDYFIIDYFFVILLLYNKTCRDIFKATPTYLTTPINLLQAAIPEEYDEGVFESIKSITPIHKLTLTYTPDNSIKDRLYHRIINGDLK